MLEVLLHAWAAVTMGSFGLVLGGLVLVEVLRELPGPCPAPRERRDNQ